MSSTLHRTSWAELIAAAVAAALGSLALLFILFGPVYSVASDSVSSDGTITETSGTAGLLQEGLAPLTAVILLLAATALVGIGLGGVVHARSGGSYRVLVVSTLLLAVIAGLGALSIGIFLLPPVALGFMTVVLAARQPTG